MRENYESIILEDHAFSEKHTIECALWQLHYRRIEELRAHLNAALASNVSATLQGRKSSSKPDRITKIHPQFRTFLSQATGFYHDLILKIRAKYGLPLSYFPDDLENQIVVSNDGNKSAEMNNGLISCYRCLIYLGDLSRLYGNADSKSRDFAAASSYYMQASSLWPSNGNPHHQNRQSFSQLLADGKASSIKAAPVRMSGKGRAKSGLIPPSKHEKTNSNSVKESAFKFGLFNLTEFSSLAQAWKRLEMFSLWLEVIFLSFFLLGPKTYNFGSNATDSGLVIVRLITILLFTVHNVNSESENQSYAEILQRLVLLQNAYTAIFEFMGHIFERCIQLHDPFESYLLAGVLIFLEWLACHPEIAAGSEVEEKEAAARSFFWNNCISFLSKLLSSRLISLNEDGDNACFCSMTRYDEGETVNLALWEDY